MEIDVDLDRQIIFGTDQSMDGVETLLLLNSKAVI
jgi:hypothetical protein